MSFIKAIGLGYDYITSNEETEEEVKIRAVDDVNLEIHKGEFVAVLGHNGSGKSTFAKHLNALLQPTDGTLIVQGYDTSDEKNIWDIRTRTGMVFQNPDNQIIANIVEEDVGFGPENLGVPTDEIWQRVYTSLSAVGMMEYKDHSPNKLSGGQKQRVAIAGVMAMRPDCIVLDEPTAMLDPSGRRDVIDTITMLNKQEGVTVILITHYMEEVIGCDRIYVMDDGKVVMQGTPKEIFSQVEILKSLRLDVPQVTELAYELKKEGIAIADGILSIDELTRELVRYKDGNQVK